jgi:hypothetical protein
LPLLGLVLLAGCQTAHDVAVSTFHVLDTPANYVRKKIDHDDQATTTTTTTTASSDTVTTPGRTVSPSATPPQRRTTTTDTRPSPTPRASPPTVTEKSKPSPSSTHTTSSQAQIPTAKPVPGKPGYVFSPFDPSGGYVDVTGYTSGQKVKDPYSGKIFLVP